MSKQLKNKKILITGGKGFLGAPLTKKLEEESDFLFTPSRKECDLTKQVEVERLFDKINPNIVIHLAADLGGISYIKENSGKILYNNTMMNALVLENSKKFEVEKFVGIGTAFSYSEDTLTPFKEEDLFKGGLNKDAISYILPKKMLLVQSKQYRKQYDLNAIHLVLANIYGPGSSESHAIPSLIKKFQDAFNKNKKSVEVWGTGNATRDLLYVDDAAEAIILATKAYDKKDPINIGAGIETKISELAEKISELTGFKGKIIYDPTKPEGLKKILLDSSKAEKEFGFRSKTSLEEGLRKTRDWILKP